MSKAQTTGEPKVLVDACPKDDGLWFDGGEVDQLVKKSGAMLTKGVTSFLGDVFKAKDNPVSK